MHDIISFYTELSDDERLFQGWGMLEFARSKEIALRHLPKHSRTVLDVGGGTGIYSEWLGELGYDAHLIDITPSHIACARSKRTRLASAEVGDARNLSWRDASADIMLLFGPLYHLTRSADRALALREARRVLRPGGIVLARDLQDGQHRNGVERKDQPALVSGASVTFEPGECDAPAVETIGTAGLRPRIRGSHGLRTLSPGEPSSRGSVARQRRRASPVAYCAGYLLPTASA